MNKTDLISKIAEDGGISKKEASRLLDIITETIALTLAEGDKVTIPSFGTFKVEDSAPRVARNFQTGKSIKIGAKKKASFSAGSALKIAVQSPKTGGGGPGGKV